MGECSDDEEIEDGEQSKCPSGTAIDGVCGGVCDAADGGVYGCFRFGSDNWCHSNMLRGEGESGRARFSNIGCRWVGNNHLRCCWRPGGADREVQPVGTNWGSNVT